ncbi:MAG: carbohydrate-binding family 9-like protein [bacterium]
MADKINIRILFCVFCIILFLYVISADADVIERSYPIEGAEIIAIKALNGNVKIFAGDKPDILIRVLIKDISAKQIQDEINKILKVENKGKKIEIEFGNKAEIYRDYELLLPENMLIEAKVFNGSVQIVGIKSKINIEVMNGNIELLDVVGSVSAKSLNGNIVAKILLDGQSDFTTANGSIDIHIKDNYSAPLSARTATGAINLIIPQGYSADIDAVSVSGSIGCDIPMEREDKPRPAFSLGGLKGKIFGGGAPLKLATISGNIDIKLDRENIASQDTKLMSNTSIEKSILYEPPVLEVTKTLNPPIIDGRLDDNCWKNAAKIEDFVFGDGKSKPVEPTLAYVTYDDRGLYIGVVCHESNMESISISATERDKWLWDDDNVQIFIDPSPESEADYYHISITPIGTIFDNEISRAEPEKRIHRQSKLGEKWNFEGAVKTDIRNNLWTIEMSIYFSSFMKPKPAEGTMWRFNLYRMEQRLDEYTYWSPVFTMEQWPHFPKYFGKLVLAGPAKITEQETLISDPSLKIAKIIIEGNNKISQERILNAGNLKIGDPASFDNLYHAKLQIESLGWFQNVGMDVIENDEGKVVLIKVNEKEIITPIGIRVEKPTIFNVEQIKNYFNLTSAITTTQDVNTKCRLIEKLYKARGFEAVSVRCSFSSDILIISIDVGHIDKIEIRGNNKISDEEILRNLNLSQGMPYERNNIEKEINNLKNRLPYFKRITWQTERSDEGLNILYIDIEEGNLVKFDVGSLGEFNRVHGLQLGMKSELRNNYWGSKSYFSFGYGFSSKIWNYQFGMEQSLFKEYKSTFGAEIHKLTDTNDREIISDTENFIAEAILGEVYRDYYQREGYELRFNQNILSFISAGIKYRDDEYTSLSKINDWSLLNRSYRDGDHKEGKFKRDNPAINDGRMKSIIGEFIMDTRNSKDNSSISGFMNTFSIERAGGGIGGDFDFTIYQANIRSYNRLSENQFIFLRMKAAVSDCELPLQRKFYLGGIGTLRGYPFKEFEGDKMALINAEYWLIVSHRVGIGMSFFIDSGYAWEYEKEMLVDDMKTDVGFGVVIGSLSSGGLIFNVAWPIKEGELEPIFSFRLARMF